MTVETLPPSESSDPAEPAELRILTRLWSALAELGWQEAVSRYASHGLLLAVVVAAIWVRRVNFSLIDRLVAKANFEISVPVEAPAVAVTELEPPDSVTLPSLAPLTLAVDPAPARISRRADLHTIIPTRGRVEVMTYTVQPGDTLFGIAENFGLKPETVLWGNYFTLKDDPHSLYPGQVLNILPVDGTYHYVTEGNTIEQIARFYHVAPEAIVDWSGNLLEPGNPKLVADTWLVIPGGHRELQVWTVPTIRRESRATRANNFGQCPGGYTGAVGVGRFVWPADNHFLSGYDFSGVHRGIDIKAGTGAPIYAADAGVVVYAGWNDYGYGNLVVVDHGNGWQSVYAHLSQWNVACGQSVSQAQVVGLAGNTGRSAGAHLHFELRYDGAFVNPWTVLP